VTEADQRARRLVIAYAILLDAFAQSPDEPKIDHSYAPDWRCWIVAYLGALIVAGLLLVDP
jgi:hypothetical protein